MVETAVNLRLDDTNSIRTDRYLTGPVIAVVAQNNENLLVGSALNTDAIRSRRNTGSPVGGKSTKGDPRAKGATPSVPTGSTLR
ncbi:hypothetical protein KM043_013737 [Ampulex compressa]|nr:hypothetical protein KM043_013737 [Ampulex compressa]